MNEEYIILFAKYLKNELSYELRRTFEYRLINDIKVSENLKASDLIPENQFVKLYRAIKEKIEYELQHAS
ncbi:MAG: hypothetical protein JXR60_01280 [Bacteroidales bacterium]|nr:hypothetical protein [Bacteroidales bacterium]